MYDLTRLNSQSFQSLVEALSLAEFGLPGEVFSTGPDAGRDFIYNGEIRPYATKGWNGYLVLQAKYKERLSNDTRDVDWLCKQLEKERIAYLSPMNGRKRPQYYIIVSNISISGSDNGTGRKQRTSGNTKIKKELTKWKEQLGLLDFDIWSSKKLERLLDMHSDVRQSYAAWVTPGDVLSQLLSQHAGVNFGEAVQCAMLKSLARDQFIQLKDAGSLSEDSIRASQIFFDLPYSRDTDGPDLSGTQTVLKQLTTLSKSRFGSHDRQSDRRQSNLIVLLGGPGQGKSTVSKFAVQLHRSELLKRTEKYKYDPNTRDLVPEIISHATEEGIHSIGTRYPVHISLPRYADELEKALAAGKKLSLLSSLADQIAQDADMEITRVELRDWLKKYPWIVLLDGLDEVPPSGARKQTVEAINAFVTEISLLSADALVVVTTRPQGFNNDLSNDIWDYWHLVDLEPKRALLYADRLGQIRYPTNEIRRKQIHEKMTRASKSQSIANIMRSPLQVAILYIIADAGGAIPTARWSLFAKYYDVLKQREMSKEGQAGSILEMNTSHLDRLHAWSGLVLHTLSERRGRAGSSFTTTEFRELLEQCLKQGGVSDKEVSKRADQLLHLALNRLVLLASRQEGQISFDVRSLQEFMAASALTVGGDTYFAPRIRYVRKTAHWRHVIQIAASRCFTENSHEHLIPTMIGLLRELDGASDADREVASGSRLSLELVADGVAVGSDVHRDQLTKHALEIIDQCFVPDVESLTRIVDISNSDSIVQKLEKYILSASDDINATAWGLAFRLSSLGYKAATDLVCCGLKDERLNVNDILSCLALPLAKEVEHILIDYFLARPLGELSRLHMLSRYERTNVQGDSSSLLALANSVSGRYGHNGDFFGLASVEGYEARILLMGNERIFPSIGEDLISRSNWGYIRTARTFVESPSSATLAAFIEDLEENGTWDDAASVITFFPWPLATVLRHSRSKEQREFVRTLANRHELGNELIWRNAEDRWRTRGITAEDLIAPWDVGSLATCDRLGVPLMRSATISIYPEAVEAGFQLLKIAAETTSEERKLDLITAGIFAVEAGAENLIAEAREVSGLPETAIEALVSGLEQDERETEINPSILTLLSAASAENKDLWERIDRIVSTHRLTSNGILDGEFSPSPEPFLNAYRKFSHLHNLILPIAVLTAANQNVHLQSRIRRDIAHSVYNSKFLECNPMITASKAVLTLIAEGISNDQDTKTICDLVLSDREFWTGAYLLSDALDGPLEASPEILQLLIEIILQIPKSELISGTLRAKLLEILARRASGLFDFSTWKDLGLPEEAFRVLSLTSSSSS